MDTMTQQARAAALRALHQGPSPLLLPTAWDVVSARLFEEAGCRALGTTSAGIAATLGYPDGERVPRDELLAVVRRIARAVAVPVTADIEAGYGDTSAAVARTARAVIAAGAVGVNLEDGTGDPEQPLTDSAAQVAKIRTVREVAAAAGVPLVVNARTDVYWLAVGDAHGRFAAAVERLRAYRAAGPIASLSPVWATGRPSAGSCARSMARSTCSPEPTRRRSRSWGGWGCGA